MFKYPWLISVRTTNRHSPINGATVLSGKNQTIMLGIQLCIMYEGINYKKIISIKLISYYWLTIKREYSFYSKNPCAQHWIHPCSSSLSCMTGTSIYLLYSESWHRTLLCYPKENSSPIPLIPVSMWQPSLNMGFLQICLIRTVKESDPQMRRKLWLPARRQ